MKKLLNFGIGSLFASFLIFNPPITLKSFADEHTEYLDSKRDSNFSSKKEQLKTIVESNITIDINQDLEYQFEVVDVLGKKNNDYASLNDAYGMYLIIKNPEAKVIYTINLNSQKKSIKKEKYELFSLDNLATSANSKLIVLNNDEISWELSPQENGRLVFGKLIEKKWPLFDKETMEVSGEWYFNAVGPGTQYINIGNKDDPLPLDYLISPIKVKIQK